MNQVRPNCSIFFSLRLWSSLTHANGALANRRVHHLPNNVIYRWHNKSTVLCCLWMPVNCCAPIYTQKRWKFGWHWARHGTLHREWKYAFALNPNIGRIGRGLFRHPTDQSFWTVSHLMDIPNKVQAGCRHQQRLDGTAADQPMDGHNPSRHHSLNNNNSMHRGNDGIGIALISDSICRYNSAPAPIHRGMSAPTMPQQPPPPQQQSNFYGGAYGQVPPATSASTANLIAAKIDNVNVGQFYRRKLAHKIRLNWSA